MKNGKFGLWLLTALVVGNMVGSGIFMLPSSLAQAASPAAVLLAWGATGVGVLMLALVFGSLAVRKPHLTGGTQAYAMALFPKGTRVSTLAGYIVAWGYWVANWAGNVAIITTFASYLSTFFPVMSSTAVAFHIGSFPLTVGNLLTFAVCTALLWAVHTLILKGIQGAGRLNFLATAAKVIGFVFFIIVTLFAFQKSNLLPFVQPRLDGTHTLGLWGQMNHAAIYTLWAFVGVESAVVLSTRARKESDVKLATIFGLLIALAIYVGITFLVMGTVPQKQLMGANKPLVDALTNAIGSAGGYIMAALGLVSLVGSTIGWILLSAEVPFQSARMHMFPQFFATSNKNSAPKTSLIVTNVASQVFIFSTISGPISNAFKFVITVATLSYLVPYIVSALYHLKLVVTGETFANSGQRAGEGVIAVLATVYSLWVIRAGTADMKTFLLGVGMLVVGIVFFPLVGRNKTGKEPVNVAGNAEQQ